MGSEGKLMERTKQIKDVLEKADAAIWDSHYAEGLSANYARAVHQEILDAAIALAGLERELAQAVETRNLAQAASNRDLEEKRSASIPWYLEARVMAWVKSRIGEGHLHRKERAMRLLEEALELAQAEGIGYTQALAQSVHVYERPVGEPRQEAAGVAVCLLGWCGATGNRLLDLAIEELERIEAKPLDQIRGSLARKTDADLVTLPEGE